MSLALDTASELFHTRRGDTYIILREAIRFPCYPIKSTDFRRWLRQGFFRQEKSLPSAEAVLSAVETLDSLAWGQGPERETFLRVAHAGGKVYVDLANDLYQVVEIDARG